MADRAGRARAVPRQETEAARLRRALARLHRPLRPRLRGGIPVCAECSGWDGQQCRAPAVPWPCRTARAAGLDSGHTVTHPPAAARGQIEIEGIR
ncbi:hypothetical protein [Streptomyces abikoensis]|uniref:Uncharacterized protein n=1 Tax=Streptomyces abikoensis TaxID=97398 RepID=A0ABW7TED9_9ACTN